jgi:hypothetical protein
MLQQRLAAAAGPKMGACQEALKLVAHSGIVSSHA